MSKNVFFEFFEIKKLDKGLFRVWILLSILWVCFVAVVIYADDMIKQAKEEQELSLTCIGKSTTGMDVYTLYSLKDKTDYATNIFRFYSLKDCEKFINHDRRALNFAVQISIGGPLLVLFLWFFLKKTYLWLYRGFK